MTEPQKQRASVLAHTTPLQSKTLSKGGRIVTHGAAIDLILGRLDKVRPNGPGRWMACCSAHPDNRASLSIREFDSGAIGLHCFAGCDVESIVSAIGLRIEDLFPPRQQPGGGRPPERKPYSARQVIEALSTELHIAWVLLSDIASGKSLNEFDRHRAGTAGNRCAMLIEELRHAR